MIKGRAVAACCSDARGAHADNGRMRRFEGVAYLSPASTLIDLHDTLRQLQLLNDALSSGLGKAASAARLGAKLPDTRTWVFSGLGPQPPKAICNGSASRTPDTAGGIAGSNCCQHAAREVNGPAGASAR